MRDDSWQYTSKVASPLTLCEWNTPSLLVSMPINIQTFHKTFFEIFTYIDTTSQKLDINIFVVACAERRIQDYGVKVII